jgi:hypothetical protein
VTEAVARGVYGVVVNGTGDVDASATSSARTNLRRDRLASAGVHAEPAPVRVGAGPSAAITGDDAAWECASCGHELASISENWRASALLVERDVVEALGARDQMVRERQETPAVVERALMCPKCASMLSMDVALAGDALDPSPRVAPRIAASTA